MATFNGDPALLGTVRHYARGFYVVDLLDPDPVHQHLNPMYLRGSQFDEGVKRGDGQRLVLQYRTTSTSGLWHAVASPDEFLLNPQEPLAAPVDASVVPTCTVEDRLAALERWSHEPVAVALASEHKALAAQVAKLEQEIARLKR